MFHSVRVVEFRGVHPNTRAVTAGEVDINIIICYEDDF
jgi:hypothetical protein